MVREWDIPSHTLRQDWVGDQFQIAVFTAIDYKTPDPTVSDSNSCSAGFNDFEAPL